MRDQQTIEKLHALKLTGMAEAFTEQLKQPDLARLSFEERQAQAQCLRRGYRLQGPPGHRSVRHDAPDRLRSEIRPSPTPSSTGWFTMRTR